MELKRIGTQLIIDLDKEEDAVGLFAVLSNQRQVAPDVLAHGTKIWEWFYSNVYKLASRYTPESSIATQSAEVLSYQPSFKRRKRR